MFITRQSTAVSGVLNLNGQVGGISAFGNAGRTMAIVNAGAGLAAINIIRLGGMYGDGYSRIDEHVAKRIA